MKSTNLLSLDHANRLLPLVKGIAAEVIERRKLRQELSNVREALEKARSPEGLTRALADLDARIYEQDESMCFCQRELSVLGLGVLKLEPLTIHFPGKTSTAKVVFCWQEGENRLCHGHPVGEEEEPRRPLKVRVV